MAEPLGIIADSLTLAILIHETVSTFKSNRKAFISLGERCEDVCRTAQSMIREAERKRPYAATMGETVDFAGPMVLHPLRKLQALLEEIQSVVLKAKQQTLFQEIARIFSNEDAIKSFHDKIVGLQQDIIVALLHDASRDARRHNAYLLKQLEENKREQLARMEAQQRAILDALAADRRTAFSEIESISSSPETLVASEINLEDTARTLREAQKTASDQAQLAALKQSYRTVSIARNLKRMEVKVDLCFAVDCTGSMGLFLGYTKRVMEQILDRMRAQFSEIKLRVAFVGYRDFDNTGVSEYEIVDFSDAETVRSQIEGVKARGGFGGDWAEDVLGGLLEVSKLSWNSGTRVLIHIGDAPPHGKLFYDHGPRRDRWYYDGQPDPYGLRPEDYRAILRSLKERGIEYYFFSMNRTTSGMEGLFKTAMEELGGVFQVVKLDTKEGREPDYEELLRGIVERTAGSIVHSFRGF